MVTFHKRISIYNNLTTISKYILFSIVYIIQTNTTVATLDTDDTEGELEITPRCYWTSMLLIYNLTHFIP